MEAWAPSLEVAAVSKRGRVAASAAACCLASAAFGRRLDLVLSLAALNAGMALLLRMCSALIMSLSAVVAVAATAVVAVAAAARWPLSDEEAARTPA